jgi:hypothetical protein
VTPPVTPPDLPQQPDAGPLSTDALKEALLEEMRRDYGDAWVRANWARLEAEWEYVSGSLGALDGSDVTQAMFSRSAPVPLDPCITTG